MGSNAQRDLRGSFSGYVFDNGRVKIEIGKDYARILNSKNNAVLVERFYPLVEINESGKWRAINFGERFINENEHDGWHSVAIGMVYEGKNISVHGFLQYYQKDKFRRYAPLYPSMQLWFSKRTEYRVIWKYEGIKIRHFEVIDNGTGWTRPPYQHGHGRIVLYNGTVNRDMRFEDGQDIVIGYENGRKAFGLNWEKSKKNLPVLSIMNNGDDLSMSIESTSQVSTLAEPSYPIPDSGGAGGSDDSDSDGLSDSLEESGWYIWLCTSGTTWHHIKVFSDPHYRDTDNDGVDDGVEYSAGTNPEDTDTDNDGLTDEQEIDYYGTYGYTWDSDEDGIGDKSDVGHLWTIIVTGYIDINQSTQNDFRFTADYLHQVILRHGYSDSDIYYLTDPGYYSQNNKFDGVTTPQNIQYAITTWLEEPLNNAPHRVDSDDKVLIYLIDHGNKDTFWIGDSYITSSELHNWINDMQSKTDPALITVVIDACYSGSFIDDLSGNKRIVITSTDQLHQSYYGLGNGSDRINGSWFGTQFIAMLDWNGISIGSAFESAYKTVQEDAELSNVEQYPLIDDNGDGIGHRCKLSNGEYILPNGGDGNWALSVYLW